MKIAIASGKGGTGKTTISTNLASFLSETEKVVLSDLDVEEPNSGLFLDGKLIIKEDKFKETPQWRKDDCILCGSCQEVCNFHAIIQLADQVLVFPELCHSCYACSDLCTTSSLPMVPSKMGELKHFQIDNLDFIESRLDIGQEQAVPLIKQANNFIDDKFKNGTLKLYDCPPGTSCPVIEATKDVDFVILVTEPTPFGLHDLKLAVDTMQELNKDFGVIINRFGVGNNDVFEYCESKNIPIIAKFPNDRRIAELYSQGELIYNKIPEFKIQLEKINNYITDLMNKGSQ